MTITDFNYESSYLPGLTCNMDVSSYWQIYPTLPGILWSRMAISHLYCKEFILADQLADLPPQVLASCGQEWQFYISTVKEFILADQWADLPPTSVQCIMGSHLWDVFGSHCGFFKKRWEFAFISE